MNSQGKFWYAKSGIAALLVALSGNFCAQAASFTWDGKASGVNLNAWDAKQNWGGSSVPGLADIANFNTVLTGNSIAPSVNINASISSILFASTATNFTFGGSALLTVGSGGILNNSSALQTFNTALSLGASQSWGGNMTFAGNISGTGPLTITGGTVTLSGSNTFSGGLTVNGGSVLVNNTTGSGVGSGNVVVNSGTFGGSGRITGGLTLNSGSHVSTGQASGAIRVGTLTTGNQTWNGGAAMDWEVKDAAGTAGTGWDTISVNGTLALNATALNKFVININSLTLANVAGNAANFDPNANYQWTFLETTGGITGFDPNAFDINTSGFGNTLLGSSQFLISLVDGGNVLAITYVPEPSTMALGILGAATLVGGCLRKRKK